MGFAFDPERDMCSIWQTSMQYDKTHEAMTDIGRYTDCFRSLSMLTDALVAFA